MRFHIAREQPVPPVAIVIREEYKFDQWIFQVPLKGW